MNLSPCLARVTLPLGKHLPRVSTIDHDVKENQPEHGLGTNTWINLYLPMPKQQ